MRQLTSRTQEPSRRRRARSLVAATAGLAAMVTGITTVAAGPAQASGSHKTRSTTTIPPSAATAPKSVMFGAVTDDLAQLTTFETDAGKKVSLYGSYASFAFNPNFDATAAAAVQARGAQPMVTWEPWDPSTGSANQPAYSLANIAGGTYDAYVTRWAGQIKAYGQPVFLRFAHEMNGDWYPWGATVNGNTPAQYVAAWRHVHDIFQQAGVTNVSWIWTPNVVMGSTPTLASLYPGDAYVDWIGADGYNWGTSQSWSSWQTFDQVFGPTLTALAQISSKPIIIGETASTEAGGSKATWINQFFSSLASRPQIKAFLWFNLNKETDWRIESSPSATAAFAAGVADPRY